MSALGYRRPRFRRRVYCARHADPPRTSSLIRRSLHCCGRHARWSRETHCDHTRIRRSSGCSSVVAYASARRFTCELTMCGLILVHHCCTSTIRNFTRHDWSCCIRQSLRLCVNMPSSVNDSVTTTVRHSSYLKSQVRFLLPQRVGHLCSLLVRRGFVHQLGQALIFMTCGTPSPCGACCAGTVRVLTSMLDCLSFRST